MLQTEVCRDMIVELKRLRADRDTISDANIVSDGDSSTTRTTRDGVLPTTGLSFCSTTDDYTEWRRTIRTTVGSWCGGAYLRHLDGDYHYRDCPTARAKREWLSRDGQLLALLQTPT